jgi:hypothetical protein
LQGLAGRTGRRVNSYGFEKSAIFLPDFTEFTELTPYRKINLQKKSIHKKGYDFIHYWFTMSARGWASCMA